MTETQMQRLTRLQRGPTRYEIAVHHPQTGDSRRICYTANISRASTLDIVKAYGPDIVAWIQQSPLDAPEIKRVRKFWRICWPGLGLIIHYTGRTERECITLGERPPLNAR